ncbi:hypothetical protein FT663_02093 [Candidozyma haemuli var. vulneris]|uniref:Shikimate dehydrogenase substrate binding N-terminal domain-containing protein n=1 Tax=Candidozyma haemuli TaxID=45357 RepID=A0A2V1AS77_9ASCO|nr:hypothetical protein CXQ85_001923 [[Candida] haemuloni]KAF3988672.1 hypothetical protein FT662_03276 [[Candida] haemuloni var. vulneris]KAF3992934.1 hypothetical protein FT663_02093 [[Candida] haemuloni var. vulneris]PVH20143.1 hypothetical protein CXQ85_001923 [[Candida] haemuloni]
MSLTLAPADLNIIRKKDFLLHLFGEGISHSKAPLMHNYLFKKLGCDGYVYECLDSYGLDAFKELIAANKDSKSWSDLKYIGSAVTMPYKVAIIPHLDEIDENAKSVGAVNTIYVRFKDGRAVNIGTNTDTVGIRDAFVFNVPEVAATAKGKPGLVYGGGGACRSAVYALKEYLGCSKIYLVNRFASEVEKIQEEMAANGFTGEIVHIATPEQAKEVANPHLIVLAVPDFAPVTDEEKLARETLDVFINQENKGAVLEMCYHPTQITRLYSAFHEAGWDVVGGIEAMIYQGFAQQVLWTGYSLDEMPTKDVVDYVRETIEEPCLRHDMVGIKL